MKLWDLNKVFRFFGFVLVVATGDETELYFQSKKKYDEGCKEESINASHHLRG